MLQQFLCWLRHGFHHLDRLEIDGGFLFLRCGYCLRETGGIWIGSRDNVIVMPKRTTAA